jgi:hypothetical protein
MRQATRRIRATLRRGAIICLFWSMGLSRAYSQSSATIKMDHGEVTAGEPLSMDLTFDKPTTCSQTVRVYMVDTATNGTQGLDVRGQLEAGKDTTTVSTIVPKDYHGEFHSSESSSFLFPCQGYSVNKPFAFTPVTVNVRGIPDPNSYPAKADVVLSLTQKQFLDTKVAELNALSGQIDTRVEQNGIDSVEIRAFLAGIVEKAEADCKLRNDNTERSF